MSRQSSRPDVMVQWYCSHIAEPSTDDEVYGYWVFGFGLLLGILGILLFLTSDLTTATTTEQAGIALATLSLVPSMIGPVIRMPLQRAATRLSYGGGLLALVGVARFLVAYPGRRETGLAIPVISLYGFGIVLIAVGAAVVPAIRSGTAVSAVEADELEPTPEAETVATEDPESEPVDEPAESKARFEVYEDRGGK